MHRHHNGLKTAALFGGMWAILLGIGWVVAQMTGSSVFLLVFAFIGVATTFYGYWNSDKLAIKAMHAQPVSEAEAPQMYRIVRELSTKAGKPMPRLYISPTQAPKVGTPLPATARRTVKEVDLLGHLIPAGVPVAVSMAATHRLPEWWTAPDRFDPDRFGPERAEHRQHPFLFSPFGGGAHKCIGMHFGELEIRSVVHHVLTRFRLSVPPGYELPVDYTSLPVAADGLPMRLERL